MTVAAISGNISKSPIKGLLKGQVHQGLYLTSSKLGRILTGLTFDTGNGKELCSDIGRIFF